MRRIALAILAATALSAGAAQSASAADMPVKAPVAVAPAAYNWTGFYIGGNVGYGWRDRTVTFTPNDPVAQFATCGGLFGGTCAPPTSFGINGALGGFQAGYNWQFSQSWLLGIEADLDWSRIRGTGTSNFLIEPGLFPPGTASFQASQNVKWFGTVRGRLGFLPTNNILLYATAGFAYGGVDENLALNAMPGALSGNGVFGFFCGAGPNCFLGSSSRTATGWTAGTGFEYALWKNISVKGEYLYVNLGGGDSANVVAVTPLALLNNPSSFTAAYSRTDFHVVRAGIDFKLGN
jgi:outer membrane immunogenic protein